MTNQIASESHKSCLRFGARAVCCSTDIIFILTLKFLSLTSWDESCFIRWNYNEIMPFRIILSWPKYRNYLEHPLSDFWNDTQNFEPPLILQINHRVTSISMLKQVKIWRLAQKRCQKVVKTGIFIFEVELIIVPSTMGTFYWTHTLLQQLQYNACIGLPP